MIVIAVIGYAIEAAAQQGRRQIVVAARYLPAGSVLQPSELRLVSIKADPSLLARLVPATAETLLLGHRLTTPVFAGLPLAQADLTTPTSQPAAFTLAIPTLHALGGALIPGERVSVLATFISSTGQATARVVARHLLVLAVGRSPAGLDRSSTTIPVTVALPNPSVAAELALANNVGKLDLLKDGSNTTAAIPASSISTGAGQ